MTTVPDANLTAIYCRKSKKGDKQQITVNRQKRLALDDCETLGLSVSPKNIYIDNGASAWQRNRKREGWDKLIESARRGEVKHIVCYHPRVISKSVCAGSGRDDGQNPCSVSGDTLQGPGDLGDPGQA